MGTAEQNRRYYLRGGKAKVTEHRARHVERNRAFVRNLKHMQACLDCGTRHPHWVMDFDHRDASTKVKEVSLMVRNAYSVGSIEAEIAKCDLVCSNCHRERTWRRAQSGIA